MKVALLYPCWTGEYGLFGHFARRNATWPPLNLALLGAVAGRYGHEVMIIDGEAERLSEEKMVERVFSLKPDIIGLTCYSPFFHVNASLAECLKKVNSKIPIMVGGPHITIMKEKALLPQFDYAFIGEAEDSLTEFLDVFTGSRDFGKVKGILFRKAGEIFSTGERWVMTDAMRKSDMAGEHPLDRFPLPARNLLNMTKYKLGTPVGRHNFTSLQTARGCPWTCIFCASDALKTTRYIMKSPKRVVEEMKDVAERFPYIKHIYIVDDVLTFWPEHIVEICDRMDAEGLKFTFESSTRANLISDELIERLARSGLIRLSFGLETIDPKMRVTMQKKVPIEAYAVANRICTSHGVEAMNSLMIGLPGETKETIRTTLDWVAEQRDIMQANLAIAIPYPGTEFHEMAVSGQHGVELLSENFADYMRYGNAVTNVGDLTAQDLIDMQNEGFVKIYTKWWRWGAMWRKHGVFGFILEVWNIIRVLKARLLKWKPLEPVMRHPKQTNL